jgi:hypothetical protein
LRRIQASATDAVATPFFAGISSVGYRRTTPSG